MKLSLLLGGIVSFAVLCSQAVMIGQKQIVATRAIQPPVSMQIFRPGTEALTVSPSGLPICVAQHREELERFYEIEAQRAVEKLRGQPLPHGTHTQAAGTTCEVLSQRGSMVEVMWTSGPALQSVDWIHSGNLREAQ